MGVGVVAGVTPFAGWVLPEPVEVVLFVVLQLLTPLQFPVLPLPTPLLLPLPLTFPASHPAINIQLSKIIIVFSQSVMRRRRTVQDEKELDGRHCYTVEERFQ
jgi:hypothetical protein